MDILQSKQGEFVKCGVEMYVQNDPFIVVIVTPIMRRVHEKKFAGEIVFVDSSGSCDQTNTVVTFIFCAGKVGALPLACVLHDSTTTNSYTAAFAKAREVIGFGGFGGAGFPSIIMTDDSDPERVSLRSFSRIRFVVVCISCSSSLVAVVARFFAQN